MATKSTLIKVSMFTTRKEGISEAEFHKYWTERHSKVVSEWLQRNGVVRYSQVSVRCWRAHPFDKSLTIKVSHALMVAR